MAEHRILIVDDQRDARRRLRLQLEAMGLALQISEVSSGEEALLVLSRQSIHLVIANLRLAGMSGLELVAKARQRQPELRAVLVLSAADKHLEDRLALGEWLGRVYKPLQARELAASVRRSLGLDDTGGIPQSAVQPEIRPEVELAERLGSLRRDLSALAVSLLDDRGQVIAQAGDQPVSDQAALIPALMAAYSAAGKVSQALGADYPQDVLFFSGAAYDLALAHVGNLAGLLVLSLASARAEMDKNLLALLRRAASDVLRILTDMGLLVPASPEQLASPADLPDEAGTETDLGDLESILQQAAGQDREAQDADQFWDALVEEQAEKKAPGTGELSYEQARQIGLTPEEDA